MTTDKPQRIRLQRTKGFNLQEASKALNGLPARSVARPGTYGNPFCIGDYGIPDSRSAVMRYLEWIDGRVVGPKKPDFSELRGKNLACWCKIGQPCHADVLLELANAD